MVSTSPATTYRKLTAYLDQIPGHRRNSRPHPSTLIRWASVGVKLPDGARLRLRAVRLGAKWVTRDDWFAEFVESLTNAYIATDSPAGFRTPGERSDASKAAEAKLKELGL
ncbi:hypothetical protein [Urbifossiella limnaea]|uniref:Uncharacterized protein n=1 Tax=Urbifossiella limnaea TaxID=2528023 RepID=A0A517XX79_9BACT|nr:hypothetical protein [Urbifossiella limnaea]QDU22110.1 hypothetical protein ETAA1_40850 [Urbifossiella limnaea]